MRNRFCLFAAGLLACGVLFTTAYGQSQDVRPNGRGDRIRGTPSKASTASNAPDAPSASGTAVPRRPISAVSIASASTARGGTADFARLLDPLLGALAFLTLRQRQ